VIYKLNEHAAHCYLTGRVLHDLESWDTEAAWNDPRPEGVPLNAERHHGYLLNGVQHVVWVRRAKPQSQTCAHCEGASL
jgi:hypothetical protein